MTTQTTSSSTETPISKASASQGNWRNVLNRSWIGALIAAFILWLVAGYATGTLSLSFLLANATIAGFLALAGTAQMIVIASGPGNFDLSLPFVITFGAYVMSAGIAGDDNIVGSLALTLLVGALAGAVNAALIVRLRIPAIVATLASGYIIYSFIVAIQSGGFSRIGGLFEASLRMRVWGISGALAVSIVTLLVVTILLSRTVFGLQLHALGQNGEAARLAGVRRGWLVLGAFVLSGVLAAWLGVLLTTYQGGVSADVGRSYLLGSVAAVVVGGTRITGGVTSVLGTAIGALVLTLAQSDLILLQFSIGAQYVIQGLIVLVTVCLVAIRSPERR
ncbi:ABC transporter permease [Sinorhizobium garamanticum]|uniref:ABC transporter permease n=1 Tax=Sinorhizobium garamanticum TaxID=680247 RepID=A0ABY8DJF5_9HYPH|nr:ABC transporter permease [Sinorhizobium garamanticum]WEX91050.1 ABC transporter permease [Sinorhizobium garamanticum]